MGGGVGAVGSVNSNDDEYLSPVTPDVAIAAAVVLSSAAGK